MTRNKVSLIAVFAPLLMGLALALWFLPLDSARANPGVRYAAPTAQGSGDLAHNILTAPLDTFTPTVNGPSDIPNHIAFGNRTNSAAEMDGFAIVAGSGMRNHFRSPTTRNPAIPPAVTAGPGAPSRLGQNSYAPGSGRSAPPQVDMDAYGIQSSSFILQVNYDHDWIQGPYEPGHTVWVTVTNSSGALKAVAKMTTRSLSWMEGFSTNDGDPWQPGRPDIQPGDWVHGAVSTGYTATVQVGRITGLVDVDADAITGAVDAPWLLPGPVRVECHTWGAPGGAPNKHTTVIPNGSDVYTCAWDPNTEWDVRPGQDVAVLYVELDGHQVFGVFRSPHPILEVHYTHDWVEGDYEPGHTVWLTVTTEAGDIKATATLTTGVIPWWDGRTGFSTNLGNPWQPARPDIQPGDRVYAAVSNGYTGTVRIGQITGLVSAAANTITGTVNAPWLLPARVEVECHTWSAPNWTPNKRVWVLPDGADVYTCAWDPLTEWDVLPGQEIGVSYREPGRHQIWDRFYEPRYDLIFNINYAHDGVEGNYEPGYTVWVTVTNETGDIKATATMTTGMIPWWGHRTGFSSHLDNPWRPERPDIRPGDWVFGAVNNGYSATVQIGRITGFTDADTDAITGTVSAPWLLPETVNVECHPWIWPAWAPNKSDVVLSDGSDVYACAWDPLTEWDVRPKQEIGVSYREPGGHQIWDRFYEPSYDLIFNIDYSHDSIEGYYEPGYTVWLTVTNAAGAIKATATLTTGVNFPWWGSQTGFSTNFGDPWQPQRPDLRPGDIIYGAVNNGYSATVQIGRITGLTDVDTDTITGTVSAPWLLPETVDVECFPFWVGPGVPSKFDRILPNGTEAYTCAWDRESEWDMQLGQEIAISYREPAQHLISYRFRCADYSLRLAVDYDADRIEGPYEPDYTVGITVTSSTGAVKATVELRTNDQGFSSDNGAWQPERPDIAPSDWIYGAVDNGATAALRVGEITGVLDLDADRITGAINAAWLLPEPVDVECYAPAAPAWIPHKYDTVTPDGSTPYACAWDAATEWNIKAGQDVAVSYSDLAGHQVVRTFAAPLEPPVYASDAIVVEQVASLDEALDRLEAGELAIYAQATNNANVVARIAASPDLEGYLSYNTYNELTFNPSGPIFAGTGKLNPFAVPRIREAMNWLVDREHIRQQIMAGMSRPRWLPINTVSRDYGLLAGEARRLERQYGYDKALAQQVIAQEMLKLPGVTRIGGKWYHNGAPVEIIVLIRVEDQRRPIGDYVSDQLEALGFTIVREYKTAAQAWSIWLQGDPAEGRFHIYTGGWSMGGQTPRDLANNFAFFYTDMEWSWPLWQAYTPTPEFYELARQLRDREFTGLAQRRAMMAQALDWAMEDSVRVWLHDNLSITPRRAEVRYASDLYGGIRSWLWPHTLERAGVFTTPLTIGAPGLFSQPWNPLDGDSWWDAPFILATSDGGTIPDPYTGLAWPQRIATATVTAQTGLPISRTLDWVTLQFAPSITVPGDAWVDWDPAAQRFRTAAEVYPQPQTARIKSVVTYPANLFTTVTWHDGSPFSLADIVMNMIRTFDRDLAPQIRGARIISQNPLVIETYSDVYQIDAELNVFTWWPYYNTGPGAWHTLALGLLVEDAREGAFSQQQANEWGVPWLDYVAWPGIIPLERKLPIAQAQNFIPYTPTLSAYITSAQAQTRWNNLAAWYAARGHFWVGTGPLYLEHALKPIGQLSLKRHSAYPDPPDRWNAFLEAPLAEVAVSGPSSVPQGVAATFDISVTLNGAPYPPADIEGVRYLLINARNEVAFSGEAVAVSDGLWRVTLTAGMSAQLPLGGNELEIIVGARRIVVPTFATRAFETTGLRVLGVTPGSGVNNATTQITITGQLFQPGAVAALLRDGSTHTLTTAYVSTSALAATAPAGLPSGTYSLRVVNPDGRSATLLAAFTVLSPTPPVITGINPQQGPNNMPITVDIYGSNLAPGLTARLNVTPLEGVAFVNSAHVRANVPLNIAPGVYTLTVTNPNGQSAQLSNAYTALESIDDLFPREGSFWLDPVTLRRGSPVTPTMGIVVNRLGGAAELSGVSVDFYYQPAGGGAVFIGRVNTPPLAIDGQVLTPPLAWSNLPAAGGYTLRAVIDPENAIPETVETNNVITRSITILPPLPDTIPPVVASFRINDGEQHTAQRQVVLNVTAQDNRGGSGIASLLYTEYVYIHSRGDWVQVASSGWLPYETASRDYLWLLDPTPGVHYIRVWAADAAGNISLYWRAAFINLAPETNPASIARAHVHTYRFQFQKGEGLTSTLTSVSGDVDIYVFGPDDNLITYSFLESPTETVSFTAARNGPFQVETYGFAAGSYRLQFTAAAARSQGLLGRAMGKLPRTEPLVSATGSPAEEGYVTGVPSAPVKLKTYLPLVLRSYRPSR